ncbi:MAG: lamin tail domain-containing protein [Anaerolineales bacterium]|nr:lamin tail domain-containing protein [Anaerolineales bacterium]
MGVDACALLPAPSGFYARYFSMPNWKKLPRVILFTLLILGLCAGLVVPRLDVAEAAPRQFAALDVIINEVAWGGTAASSTDEWIELYNPTGSTIDLSGWTLVSSDASPNITLTGTIPAGGYYLLESGDDFTISDIKANKIYSGGLVNAGEILTLRDNSANTIDTANISGGAWDAGSGSPNYYSMERNGVVADSATAWISNNGITRNGLDAGIPSGCTTACTTSPQPINGTPHNSQADLSVSISPAAVSPNINTNIIFTVTVTNGGPNDATNVIVKDLLPASLSYVTNDIGAAYDSGTGMWNVGSLLATGPGSSATINITAKVVSGATSTNAAEVWSVDQPDPDSIPGNGIVEDDYASAQIIPIAPGNADLSLTMTYDRQILAVGDNVVFTLALDNAGPDDAANVSVKDLLPVELTYVSNDGGAAYNSVTGIWTVGTVPSGANAVLNITAKMAGTGKKAINRAEVWTSDQSDPDSAPGNNSTTEDDDDVKTVGPALNITNIVNIAAPSVGDNILFTITVGNPSATLDATNAKVDALLPSGLDYVSSSSPSYDGASGVWTIGALPAGSSATLNVTAQVVSSGKKDYLARVSSNEFVAKAATESVTPIAGTNSDLSLSQTLTKSTSTADVVALTLKVHNNGPDAASGVQVNDLLPSGLTYISSTPSGKYNSESGIWTLGSLAKAADATLTINVRVRASGSSTNNFAEIWTSDQFDADSTPGNGANGEDDETSLEVPIADLSISQTVDITGTTASGTAFFTIGIKNNGPDNAAGVNVKTSLTSSAASLVYAFVSYGSTKGTYDKNTGIWTIGALADGESAELTITTTTMGALVSNWVEVSSSSVVDPDSVPNNNSRTEDDDDGKPSADLRLTMTVDNTRPDIGDLIRFTLQAANDGPESATNVQIKDKLPADLVYVSSSSAAYNNSSGIWSIDQINKGATKTLTITARVQNNGAKINKAEIWFSNLSDPDSTPGNNSTTEDDDASVTVQPISQFRSVLINEVAWMGTAASSSDEWIELYNPSATKSINISGWKLRSSDGSLTITLSGSIPADGYLVFSHSSTVFNDFTIPASQVFSGYLSNYGVGLTLYDGTNTIIDTANNDLGYWPAGLSSPSYASMERYRNMDDGPYSWATFAGTLSNPVHDRDGNKVNGTPGRANWALAVTITPTGMKTSTPARTPTPSLEGRFIINEFLPRPGYDWNQDGRVDVFDEFIEIKNIGNLDINMNGWKIDDEKDSGSAPFALPNKVLKPGERAIFFGLDTNILLSDGGDTVRLINSSGKVYDSYTYAIAKTEDKSVCRLPDGSGSWYEDCLPTPNLVNTRAGYVPVMANENYQSPVCSLPDTLPADFLFAECRGYGAHIWRNLWDGGSLFHIHEDKNKWESFIE